MTTKQITDEQAFYCQDGSVLRSLLELADHLETMHDDTFNHHVTSDHNDFYNWIVGVFKKKKLAVTIKDAQSAHEMAEKLREGLTPKPAKRKSTPKAAKPTSKKRAHTALQRYISGFAKKYGLF